MITTSPTKTLQVENITAYIPHQLRLLDVREIAGPNRIVSFRAMLESYGFIRSNMFEVTPDTMNFKPILRPLSDLIKEIDLRDGTEKFIPIQKLAEITSADSEHGWRKFTALKDVIGTGVREDLYFVRYKGWSGFEREFSFSANIEKVGFVVTEQRSKEITSLKNLTDTLCFVPLEVNQYVYWDLLYQWHFDVGGLIKKGLAIDINELNNTNEK